MARDAELWELARKSGLHARVYTWDGAWVSLGKNQSINSAILPNAPVKVVVRPTGGKAVLHGHDVTIGLAGNLHDLQISDSRRIKEVYRVAIQPVIDALVKIGIPAALAEDTVFCGSGRSGRMDCFAHTSPNDVVSTETGAKICGSALVVDESAFLAQISIPSGAPLVDPKLVFDSPWLDFRQHGIEAADLANSLESELHKLLPE